MTMDSCKLALDIGGTAIKYGLIANGQVISSGEMAIDSNGPVKSVVEAFQSSVRAGCQMAREHALDITGIGASVPGPFDYQRGVSLMKHKYSALYNVPLREKLLEPIGNLPLVFMSDTGAFLMGALDVLEPAAQNVCAITLGTGIGFAGCFNGRLQSNSAGGPMLRLFAMPYGDGCAEDYVSKRAFEQRYRKMQGESISVKEMALRARCNEQAAKGLFEQAGADILRLMTPIMKEHGFSCLIIGGQIAKACDLMLPAMYRVMGQSEERFQILPAGEITQAALLGVVYALDKAAGQAWH